MNFVPSYKSTTGDIRVMRYAPGLGALLVAADGLKVRRIDEFPQDAFGRGLTAVYAQIQDGNGHFAKRMTLPVYYDLYQSVVRLESGSVNFQVVKDEVLAHSVYRYAKVRGVYLSEVLKADEDFGFWKYVSWHQTGNVSRVVVALRTGTTEEECQEAEWWYLSETSEAVYGNFPSGLDVVKDLDRFNITGRFIQFKIELETTISSDVPIVTDFVITYVGKHSVYFFTKKIKIGVSEARHLLLTASTTTPVKTEVRFGITDSNSADWEDYRIITLDRLVKLSDTFGKKIKVGIKLTSHDSVAYPIVEEFAFLVDGEGEPLTVDED